MRSFAQVEHPHFIQRPVPPNPLAFQNSHLRQASSLISSEASSVFKKLLLTHLLAALAKLCAIDMNGGGFRGFAGCLSANGDALTSRMAFDSVILLAKEFNSLINIFLVPPSGRLGIKSFTGYEWVIIGGGWVWISIWLAILCVKKNSR